MLRFTGWGVTDVGLVRDHNEDSAFLGPYVALVADGVGGAAAGEMASATAAYVVSATARSRQGDNPANVLTDAIEETAASLTEGVEADFRRSGMATTLTAVVTDGSDVVMAHIGDSRGYLFRHGHLKRVSSDHTYVQKLVDEGQLAPTEAGRHPWRNVVLRSLHGREGDEDVRADLIELGLVPGDRMLLCSDGLTDMVTEERIAEILCIEDPERSASRLVKDALVAGGTDNITCVVFDVVDGPPVVGDGQVLGAVRDIANIVDPGRVRAG